MGKREADKQLTDRDRDDGDDDHTIGEGFQKAPETEVAVRKIRGLPQRKTPGATPQASPAAPPAASSFGGFGGGSASGSPFGGASTNPFAALVKPTTTTPPSAPSAPPAFGGFSFGSSAATPAPPIFGAPAPSANGSSTSFSFAPSATPPAPAPAKPAPTPFTFGASTSAPAAPKPSAPATSTSSSAATPSADLTYFLACRGLNESLVAAIQAQVEADVFADLAGPLVQTITQYCEHREKFMKDYLKAGGKIDGVKLDENEGEGEMDDEEAEEGGDDEVEVEEVPAAIKAVEVPSIVTTPPVVPKPTPAPVKAAIAPPAPPASFSFGGQVVKAPTASSTPVTGGFTPKFGAPEKGAEKSAFSFPIGASAPGSAPAAPVAKVAGASSFLPPPSPKPAALPTPASVVKLANTPAAPSPLRFGRSASPEAPVTEAPPAAPAGKFSFGASFGTIAKGDSPKKDEPKAEAQAATVVPSFSFGAPAQSTPTKAPAAPFFGAPSGSPPITSSFGAASPPSFNFGAALGDKKVAPGGGGAGGAAGFSFGSSVGAGSAAPATSAFGGFGGAAKPSTGFSFGAPAGSSGSPAAPSAFSFGAPATFSPAATPSPAPSTTGTATGDDDGATAPEDGAPAINSTPGGNPFAAAGAGEEGESVLHEWRVKLWKLNGAEAAEQGVVKFMVKQKDADSAEGKKVRRILARNEVNGKVVANFRLIPTFAATANKTFVEFVGFDGSSPQAFRLRIKTGPQAELLAKELTEAAKEV